MAYSYDCLARYVVAYMYTTLHYTTDEQLKQAQTNKYEEDAARKEGFLVKKYYIHVVYSKYSIP